ncbi:MAG: hypothetical protein GXO97_06765 [Nitrospirae bacterium]|nr:hypothetical protein [Nitrospirota bacterium]
MNCFIPESSDKAVMLNPDLHQDRFISASLKTLKQYCDLRQHMVHGDREIIFTKLLIILGSLDLRYIWL